MIRTQIQLTEAQSKNLKTLSQKRGISVAGLIRQSIDVYIQTAAEPSLEEKRRRALSVIGIVASGKTDLGANHNHYLLEAYGGAE